MIMHIEGFFLSDNIEISCVITKELTQIALAERS
jgi:hypothetical protein